MLLEISGEITPERIKRKKAKQHPVMDMAGMAVQSNAVKSNNA